MNKSNLAILILTDSMTELQVMERNLAKMMREHQSTPYLQPSEPVDPFQKRQFGKKMRKSAVTILNDHVRNSSLPHLESHHQKGSLVQLKAERNEDDSCLEEEEMQYYKGEVESLIARLKLTLQRVEDNYKGRISNICRENTGRDRQTLVENLLGNLEGSIEFIVNDCLNINQQSVKPNQQSRHNPNKQNQNSLCNVTHSSVESKPVRPSARPPAKSIYESVLEQRGMRRSKRRAI